MHRSILIFIKLLPFLMAFTSIASHASGDSGVRFSVIKTAQSAGSLEAMVVAGGRWFEKRNLVHTAVLVQHPEGDLLWDSGIGREIASQMEAFGFLDRQLFKVESVEPARDQLEANRYPIEQLKAVIPSHMHWDHVSGLEDFAEVPVWVQASSLEEAQRGRAPAFVASQYDDPVLQWKTLKLQNEAYRGFENSFDVYGDGSVVLVDLSGHSQGHLGLFLTLANGQEYFFIGDTTWVIEGIRQNASRPVFVDWMVGVDTDMEKNARRIQQIHQLATQYPDLTIVPAHDERVMATLPVYPQMSE